MRRMGKWYMPLMVMGAGGLGVLALAAGGPPARRWILNKLGRAPQAFEQWNEAAQTEVERLRSALDGISASVPAPAKGSGSGGLPVM